MPKDYYFIFRHHPNSKITNKTLRMYFEGVDESCFSFDSGKTDLYGLFNDVDFHITRFSSTCFEASLFNVKTLVYGVEAYDLYENEILSGELSWTKGDVNDLNAFLTNGVPNKTIAVQSRYIQSSIELTKSCLSI